MKNYIAFDVSSEVCTVCVMGSSGRIMQEAMVVTEAEALKRFVRGVPRPREVVYEEGCQAAWLYTLFEPICERVTVCDPVKNADLLKKSKGDKVDARRLASWGRAGLLSPVWHGGEHLQKLKETLRTYQEMVTHSTRLKNQIKAVFRSRGIKGSSKAYDPENRKGVVEKLPLEIQRLRVSALGELLDKVTCLRESVKGELIRIARQCSMYQAIKSIDGFGEILSAMFVAEVGDPFRFRTRRQFWSYCGLAVVTHGTAEYFVDEQGRFKRNYKATGTRGLVRQYNRTLKYVFKHAAFTASKNQLKEQYENISSNTKNNANAQLTLARKLAAVALRLAKTGGRYNVKQAFALH